MKLSEYKDEQALDLLADLFEPVTEILSDEDVRTAAEKGNKAKAISVAIKNHKDSVIAILAILDGVPKEDYHCNVFTLPLKLIELISDPAIHQLFTFAGQREEPLASGSHTENIEAAEQ